MLRSIQAVGSESLAVVNWVACLRTLLKHVAITLPSLKVNRIARRLKRQIGICVQPIPKAMSLDLVQTFAQGVQAITLGI